MKTESQNATISAHILALISQGSTIENAINAVLGPGKYEAIAAEIYTILRCK